MNFRELEQKVKDIEEKLNKITSKTHEFTEENFYKAYDECVRLFRGE